MKPMHIFSTPTKKKNKTSFHKIITMLENFMEFLSIFSFLSMFSFYMDIEQALSGAYKLLCVFFWLVLSLRN